MGSAEPRHCIADLRSKRGQRTAASPVSPRARLEATRGRLEVQAPERSRSETTERLFLPYQGYINAVVDVSSDGQKAPQASATEAVVDPVPEAPTTTYY